MTSPVDDVLGCAERYDAVVHYQGGRHVWAHLDGLTALNWGRKLDDYSEASVTVAKRDASRDCLAALGRTQNWAHELSIYRDRQLVWQGPIIQIDETRGQIVIDARDMLTWLDRRVIHPIGPASLPSWRWHYHWWEARPAGEIIHKMLSDGFTGNYPDPGLFAHARIDIPGTPLATTELMYGDTEYIGTVVRDILPVGMDMFTLARKCYFIPEGYRLARAPYRLGQRHFLDDLTVRKIGLDTATRGVLVGGNVLDHEGNPMPPFPPAVEGQPELDHPPVRGAAGGTTGETGYGLIEKLSTSDNTTDDRVANGIAARIRAYGFPPPVALLVPDGARLDPSAPVSIGQLVPGRTWRVQLDDYVTPVAGGFRLSEVDVTWTADDTEQVAVSLVTTTLPPPATEESTA